jgi:hypothetical protein
MQNHKITLFSKPDILQFIGAHRLDLFLQKFVSDLSSANLTLPTADAERPESFAELAKALQYQPLPARLQETLLIIEQAALPEKADELAAAFNRHLPNVHLPASSPQLVRALELWLWSPDTIHEIAAERLAIHDSPFAPNEASPIPNHICADSPHSNDQDLPLSISHSPPAVSLSSSDAPSSALCPPSLPETPPSIGSAKEGPPLPLGHPGLHLPPVEPWPEPVDGKELLDQTCQLLKRFVVLPKWAAETITLWVVHTYAFELRDVSTYLGIESPARRCGKTTLLTILCRLVHRPVVAANVSSPAFYRAIEELRPTLMIDEADTFLKGNDELKGILNAGYKRDTAFVLRVNNQTSSAAESASSPQSQLAFFSCWCPKIISRIGKLPETLADRCILIRMHRKTAHEECERLRNLETTDLRRKCVRFVADNSAAIGSARPIIPSSLNDRAADIWEPLLAIADLAGGHWPELARQAAIALSSSQEVHPIGSLFLDMFCAFVLSGADRLFTRDIINTLNYHLDRPWGVARNGKPITDIWLAQQLAPYGIRSKTIWIGDDHAKGYLAEDIQEICRRYVSRAELDALLADRAPKSQSETPSPSTMQNGSPDIPQETVT